MDHGSIVGSIATGKLKPIGVRRKGRSRTWLDDQGWWMNVVEFQPFSGRRGTALNIAAMWLWGYRDHITFDEPLAPSSRKHEFIAFKDPESFDRAFTTLINELVLPEVDRFRQELSSLSSALSAVKKRVSSRHGRQACWPEFHLAHLYALNNQIGAAIEIFDALERSGRASSIGWFRDRASLCKERLTQLQGNPTSFVDTIEAEIRNTRTKLKLPEWLSEKLLHGHTP